MVVYDIEFLTNMLLTGIIFREGAENVKKNLTSLFLSSLLFPENVKNEVIYSKQILFSIFASTYFFHNVLLLSKVSSNKKNSYLLRLSLARFYFILPIFLCFQFSSSSPSKNYLA